MYGVYWEGSPVHIWVYWELFVQRKFLQYTNVYWEVYWEEVKKRFFWPSTKFSVFFCTGRCVRWNLIKKQPNYMEEKGISHREMRFFKRRLLQHMTGRNLNFCFQISLRIFTSNIITSSIYLHTFYSKNFVGEYL